MHSSVAWFPPAFQQFRLGRLEAIRFGFGQTLASRIDRSLACTLGGAAESSDGIVMVRPVCRNLGRTTNSLLSARLPQGITFPGTRSRTIIVKTLEPGPEYRIPPRDRVCLALHRSTMNPPEHFYSVEPVVCGSPGLNTI